MIYILIFVWQAYSGNAETSTNAIEFNSLEACQAASVELRKQAIKERAAVPLLICAAKGNRTAANGAAGQKGGTDA
jgi:hypothetical protein